MLIEKGNFNDSENSIREIDVNIKKDGKSNLDINRNQTDFSQNEIDEFINIFNNYCDSKENLNQNQLNKVDDENQYINYEDNKKNIKHSFDQNSAKSNMTNISNLNLNLNRRKETIPPIGELNSNLVEIKEDYLIYEGICFNLTKKVKYIKKAYRNDKFKVLSCCYRRKDESFRKGLGNFYNAQIILDLDSKTEKETLIFKKISMICTSSSFTSLYKIMISIYSRFIIR